MKGNSDGFILHFYRDMLKLDAYGFTAMVFGKHFVKYKLVVDWLCSFRVLRHALAAFTECR